ncbi:MAG: type II toxin-antitoxin system ParD family antitoxin [Acidobacteriaceae bacterium]
MNVSLTPKMEKWIVKRVKEGKYQTASEVVREALRNSMEREAQLSELRRLVQEGIDDVEAGRVSELSFDEIRAEARKQRVTERHGSMKRVG